MPSIEPADPFMCVTFQPQMKTVGALLKSLYLKTWRDILASKGKKVAYRLGVCRFWRLHVIHNALLPAPEKMLLMGFPLHRLDIECVTEQDCPEILLVSSLAGAEPSRRERYACSEHSSRFGGVLEGA